MIGRVRCRTRTRRTKREWRCVVRHDRESLRHVLFLFIVLPGSLLSISGISRNKTRRPRRQKLDKPKPFSQASLECRLATAVIFKSWNARALDGTVFGSEEEDALKYRDVLKDKLGGDNASVDGLTGRSLRIDAVTLQPS